MCPIESACLVQREARATLNEVALLGGQTARDVRGVAMSRTAEPGRGQGVGERGRGGDEPHS